MIQRSGLSSYPQYYVTSTELNIFGPYLFPIAVRGNQFVPVMDTTVKLAIKLAYRLFTALVQQSAADHIFADITTGEYRLDIHYQFQTSRRRWLLIYQTRPPSPSSTPLYYPVLYVSYLHDHTCLY